MRGERLIPTGTGCMQFAEDRGPLCGGHGDCILYGLYNNLSQVITEAHQPYSKCVCDPGWTGVADLINMNDRDCPYNIALVRFFFSLLIISTLTVMTLSVWRLTQSFLSFRDSHPRAMTWADRKQNAIKFLRIPVVPLSIMSAISAGACFIFFVIRIIFVDKEEWVIGYSWVTTIARIIEVIFFFPSCAVFSFSWMTVTVSMAAITGKTKKQATRTLRTMRHILIFDVFIGSVIVPFFVLLIHFFPDMYSVNILSLCYCQVAGLCGLFLTLATTKTGLGLIKILQKGTEHLPTDQSRVRKVVIGNIKKRIRGSVTATGLTFIICTVIAWWPWFRGKINYMIPIVGFDNMVVLCISLFVLKPPPRKHADPPNTSSRSEKVPIPLEVITQPSTKNLESTISSVTPSGTNNTFVIPTNSTPNISDLHSPSQINLTQQRETPENSISIQNSELNLIQLTKQPSQLEAFEEKEEEDDDTLTEEKGNKKIEEVKRRLTDSDRGATELVWHGVPPQLESEDITELPDRHASNHHQQRSSASVHRLKTPTLTTTPGTHNNLPSFTRPPSRDGTTPVGNGSKQSTPIPPLSRSGSKDNITPSMSRPTSTDKQPTISRPTSTDKIPTNSAPSDDSSTTTFHASPSSTSRLISLQIPPLSLAASSNHSNSKPTTPNPTTTPSTNHNHQHRDSGFGSILLAPVPETINHSRIRPHTPTLQTTEQRSSRPQTPVMSRPSSTDTYVV